MNVSYNLPYRAFNELLFDFAERVKKYEYAKMDYSVWKELNKLPNNIITINFYLTEATPNVEIKSDGYYTAFVIGENNFGGYLDTMRIRDGIVNWVDYIVVDDESLTAAKASTASYTIDTIATLNDYDYDKYATAENPLAAKSTADTISIDSLSLSDMDAKTVTIKPSNYTWHNHAYDTTAAIGNCGSLYVTKEEIENMESSIAKLEDLIATKADKANTYATALAAKADYVQPTTTTLDNNRKEDKFMKNFKFDFGPVNGNVVRMSMYGLAIQNKTGNYVSYDAKNGEIMDVDVLNFNGSNFLYKMPVAIKDIAIGDVIVHLNTPMFVVGVGTDSKSLIAVDPVCGERKDIMLTKSPFGFNFATKIVNFLGNAFNGAASADNPFGNMWMLMAMNGDNQDMSDVLPYMMLANGGDIDPTMMMFMAMSGKGNNDMLPFLMMMNANKPAAACKCECNCGKE